MNQILSRISEYVAIGQAVIQGISALIDLADRYGKGEVSNEDFDREIAAIDAAILSANAKDRQKLRAGA